MQTVLAPPPHAIDSAVASTPAISDNVHTSLPPKALDISLAKLCLCLYPLSFVTLLLYIDIYVEKHFTLVKGGSVERQQV